MGLDAADWADIMIPHIGLGVNPASKKMLKHVPASVMDVACKQLPGYIFDAAYQMKIDGKNAYEVRRKDKRGKVREVEVSISGEAIAIGL
jgi:hypothetical protein